MVIKHRYQPLPHLVVRLSELHQQQRLMSKRMKRLTLKIAEKTELSGITVNQETHQDVLSLLKSKEVSSYFEKLPEDSFRQLFWKQQLEAATQKNARCMKWHPLMIRWCLSLRHRLAIIITVEWVGWLS